jgi:riboflavin synthase
LFTGITEELGKVKLLTSNRLTFNARKVLEDTGIGSSMAVNGVCLTVTSLGTDYFTIDIMPETLRHTNLGTLKVGDEVNLERALALGGRMGGHLVEGHIDDTGKIIGRQEEGDAVLVRIEAPRDVLRYVVIKGFIAVDGISLTIVAKDERSFSVSLVTHTRTNTTLDKRKIGDAVNLEVDIIAKYVEAMTQSKGVTMDFLREHGFLVK